MEQPRYLSFFRYGLLGLAVSCGGELRDDERNSPPDSAVLSPSTGISLASVGDDCKRDQSSCSWFKDWAAVARTPNSVAVLRAYDAKGTRLHLHTIWPGELTDYVLKKGWVYEGVAIRLYVNPTAAAMNPIYRIYHSATGAHILQAGKPIWAKECKPNGSAATGNGRGMFCEGLLGHLYKFRSATDDRVGVLHFERSIGAMVNHLYVPDAPDQQARKALLASGYQLASGDPSIGYYSEKFQLGIVGTIFSLRDLTVNKGLINNPQAFLNDLQRKFTPAVTFNKLQSAIVSKLFGPTVTPKSDHANPTNGSVADLVVDKFIDLVADQLLVMEGNTHNVLKQIYDANEEAKATGKPIKLPQAIVGGLVSGVSNKIRKEVVLLANLAASAPSIADIIPGFSKTDLRKNTVLENALGKVDKPTFAYAINKVSEGLIITEKLGAALATGKPKSVAVAEAKVSANTLVATLVKDVRPVSNALADGIAAVLKFESLAPQFLGLIK